MHSFHALISLIFDQIVLIIAGHKETVDVNAPRLGCPTFGTAWALHTRASVGLRHCRDPYTASIDLILPVNVELLFARPARLPLLPPILAWLSRDPLPQRAASHGPLCS